MNFKYNFLIFEIQETLMFIFIFRMVPYLFLKYCMYSVHPIFPISIHLSKFYAQIFVFHLMFSPVRVWYQLSTRNPPNNKQNQVFCVQNTALLIPVFSYCNNQTFKFSQFLTFSLFILTSTIYMAFVY